MIEPIEKLREYAEQCCPEYEDHDSRMMEIADAIEAEIAERYMPLPVDADGVPIRVGDVMCSAGIREKGHKVIVSAHGFVEYGSDNGLIGPLCQEDWVHSKPRTVEDVLGDFYVAAVKTGGIDALGYQNAIERYAAELRMRDAE